MKAAALTAWCLLSTAIRYAIVDFPLFLLGLVLVPLATTCGAYTRDGSARWTWPIMWPYQNVEDGIDGQGIGIVGGTPAQREWIAATNGWSNFRRVFVWSALRNSVNNLRSVPGLSPIFDPPRIKSIVSPPWTIHNPAPPKWPTALSEPGGPGAWAVCWQGPYVGLTRQFGDRIVRIGYDLRPGDQNGVNWIANRGPRAKLVISIGSV